MRVIWRVWGVVEVLTVIDYIALSSPIIAVIIGSTVAWCILQRRRRDDYAMRVRDERDAHKILWHALHQMEGQAKRKGGGQVEGSPHEFEQPYDSHWLRDHIRNKSTSLSPKIHDAYDAFLKEQYRFVLHNEQKVELTIDGDVTENGRRWRGKIHGAMNKQDGLVGNLSDMQQLAWDEWQRLEGIYNSLGMPDTKTT